MGWAEWRHPGTGSGLLCELAPKMAKCMANTPPGAESPAIVDRRLCLRRSVPSLAYVDLGENNGGVILNIGEGGLAVTLVSPLYADVPARMRFQLPGSSDWLEASGEIARISESKKEVGLRFVDLSGDAHNRIKNWVLAESLGHSQTATAKVSGEGEQPAASAPAARTVKSVTADFPGGGKLAPDHLGQTGDPLRYSDRRVHVRRSVPSLAYVDLGENNGGVILNIGEGGLAVTSVSPLYADVPARMRFQLPGSADWLEASGEIARISESKKEAGLRFVGLSEDTREQIKGWISSELSPGELQRDGVGGREKAWRRLEMPILGVPQSMPPPLTNSDPITRKYAQVAKSTRNAASTPTVASRTLSAFGYRPGVEEGNRSKESSPRWRAWAIPTVVVLLGAFLAGWFTSDPGVISRIFARPGITPTENGETATGVESSPAGLVASTPGPSTQNAHPYGSAPEPASSSMAGVFANRPASNPPAQARGREFASANREANVGGSPARVAHSPAHAPESGPGSATAPVVSPAKDNSAPRGLGNVATTTQETNSSTPPSPSVNQPDGAPAGGTTEQASLPPSKSVENPEASKTSISVSFGLYPSIRIPTGLKSQMSQQARFLQIGQLLSRVDPVYPADAQTQHIEGAVKLHAIIGPDGTIESVEPRSGPALLMSAAANAVRQWRYTPSSVGGQPVEAEVDITITFRLLEQAGHPN